MLRALFAVLLFCLGAARASAEAPRVIADIGPVRALVARVMQGVGAPDVILPPGASPHGYAMRPSQASALGAADLVVWIGPGLTPWLETPLARLAPQAGQIVLLDLPGTTTLEMRAVDGFAGHDHAADHDHSAIDPHAWLDPENASFWLAVIATELARRDPENADTYRANAAEGQQEIAGLQSQISELLTPLQGMPFIVLHDAFHYFEARFGIEAAAAITASDDAAPSAARLAQVRDVVAATGARCVLTEPQFNQGLVAAVAANADLQAVVFDPLAAGEGVSYLSLLKDNAERLAGCLQR